MKKLNIIEASNMPVGTEFDILTVNGIESTRCKVEKSGSCNMLAWIHNDISIGGTQKLLNATFIPVQKPVSVKEAMQASLENKIIWSIVGDRKYTYYPKENKYEELTARETHGGISAYEILEGKWYIEED